MKALRILAIGLFYGICVVCNNTAGWITFGAETTMFLLTLPLIALYTSTSLRRVTIISGIVMLIALAVFVTPIVAGFLLINGWRAWLFAVSYLVLTVCWQYGYGEKELRHLHKLGKGGDFEANVMHEMLLNYEKRNNRIRAGRLEDAEALYLCTIDLFDDYDEAMSADIIVEKLTSLDFCKWIIRNSSRSGVT